MSLILYKIIGREIQPTEETELENDKIYIIIDKSVKKGKIWIWSGPESKSMDRYFAGVSATKIKSKKRLYGASIEVVQGGNEPEHFPDLAKSEIKEASEEKIEFEKVIVPYVEKNEEFETQPVKTFQKYQVKTKQASIPEGITKDKKEEIAEEPTLSLLKQKFKSFLEEITLDMEKMQKKINNFINKM